MTTEQIKQVIEGNSESYYMEDGELCSINEVLAVEEVAEKLHRLLIEDKIKELEDCDLDCFQLLWENNFDGKKQAIEIRELWDKTVWHQLIAKRITALEKELI